jgi:hypothetical protein
MIARKAAPSLGLPLTTPVAQRNLITGVSTFDAKVNMLPTTGGRLPIYKVSFNANKPII